MLKMTYQGVYTSPRLFAVMIIAISGGLTWIGIEEIMELRAPLDLGDMVRLTTACAFLGGLLGAPLFGRDGVGGLLLALLGACVATAVGACLAGVALEGPQAAPIAIALVFAAVLSHPVIGGVWVALMLLAHVAAGEVSPQSYD